MELNLKVIGTDKIGFIECEKHASTSLNILVEKFDFIRKTEEHYPSEKIILFPWRDEFESVKSGFLQDITAGTGLILSRNETYENLLGIFRYLFNRENNTNILKVGDGHKRLHIDRLWLDYFLTDNNKFYFFDMHNLSNPKLIEWISKHDPQWKDVSISHHNSTHHDEKKEKIKDILSQIKDELGENYYDYEDINNWLTFKFYYEFSRRFFLSRRKSKQFLDFDNM
jgi:hypothetical protein